MADKPTTSAGYLGGHVDLVHATCLYVATKLGDLVDEVVVVGGLAPSLLIDQQNLAEGIQPHVGTMDLDIGLTMAVLDENLMGCVRRANRCRPRTQFNHRGKLWVSVSGGYVSAFGL